MSSDHNLSKVSISSEFHTEIPVRESIRQLGPDSWIIGGCLFLSRTTSPGSPNTWSEGKCAYFTVSNNTLNSKTLPLGTLLPADGPIQQVHDAGDASAVWSIGDAFLKVRALHSTASYTREHVTLGYLNDPSKSKLTFPIPRTLFHAEFGGRYYLFTSRVPGQTLETAWPAMDESSRQFCVERLVDICRELARYGGKGAAICGVDGKHLNENWMSPPGEVEQSPQAQLDYCNEVRMDCSDLVLSHNDMGPYNVIIVDLVRKDQASVGIIDWEMAGFVPRDWIRTKFRICHAMDFDFPGHNGERMSERLEWRRRVQLKLGEEGFHDVSQAYMARWHASNMKR